MSLDYWEKGFFFESCMMLSDLSNIREEAAPVIMQKNLSSEQSRTNNYMAASKTTSPNLMAYVPANAILAYY
jgi:hypothetical protein